MAEQAASVPLLSVRDLHVQFPTERGTVNAVNGVSFDLYEGKTLAIVGESGSGKSVTAKTLMNLLPRTARVSGEVSYDGKDVRALAAGKVKHFFGVQMTMVFQDPMTSLNPVKKVGEQIAETLRYHLGRSRGEALEEAEELLNVVGIPEPARRVSQYPHELSGRAAPAGGHRHGPGLPATAADRRRAHHRGGRDRAEASPGPA